MTQGVLSFWLSAAETDIRETNIVVAMAYLDLHLEVENEAHTGLSLEKKIRNSTREAYTKLVIYT